MDDTGPPTGLQHKVGGLPQWAWIGLATAAAVVGMVWWKSRSANTTTASTTSTSTTDSTAVGNGLATEQYESLLALLRDLQGNQSTPVDTTPTPTQTSTAPTETYSSVQKGWGVNMWIRDLQQGHGEGGGNPDITWDKLVAMNPSILANVYNLDGPSSKDSERNVFRDAARYRIK